ncbi:MAG: trypsin-like peptidase domain-containing protein [Bacillota bacterium]|nr:trypsin-like peptidase domain-containing protein [Bacillota bacterium]
MYNDPFENNDKNETTGYRPNFVMRDAPEEKTEKMAENSSYREASWNNYEPKRKKPSAKIALTRKTVALLMVCCLVLSSLFGFGGAMAYNKLMGDTATTAQTTASSASTQTAGYTLESATGSNMTIQEITNAAKNSVVEIKTEGVVSDSWMQQYVTEGAGSGVIISDDGYIMTNNHVIEGAGKITVTTADEQSYDATLVGTDSTNDVAVLKIKASGLTPATYGNSDKLNVGDMAIAIGNPLGELGGTVTAGIISAKDRQLVIDGKTMTLLQTDSSINPGNSGGGLFNGSGQLIGLVVAKSSGSDVEGLGFAIPINTAADVAQQLMTDGYVKGKPWTGMTYSEGSSGFDSFFGMSSSSVYIYSVDTETARKAGFEAGDVVSEVDGKKISTIDDLSAIITAHKVGDKLTFKIVRNNQEQEIKLELQEKKAAD